MRIRIVSVGESNAWILGKIAARLKEELIRLGVDADISDLPDYAADINHHMLYLDYDISKASSLDTLMITHVDNRQKLEGIKNKLTHAKAGICMSAATMHLLQDYGIPPAKLCFINPAHDNAIQPKRIVIGIATAVYADGRKREQLLMKIADSIDHSHFTFQIMGSGWSDIVTSLTNKGFDIQYDDQFDYNRYVAMVKEWDYYLYLGQDEGSMGFVDALAAGVKTIVTPQGYHLDAPGGITHSFNTAAELASIFKALALDQEQLMQSVSTWTWDHYAKKHLEVWNHLITGRAAQSFYADGLNSLVHKSSSKINWRKKLKTKYRIFYLTFSRFLHSKDKLGKIKRKLQH